MLHCSTIYENIFLHIVLFLFESGPGWEEEGEKGEIKRNDKRRGSGAKEEQKKKKYPFKLCQKQHI